MTQELQETPVAEEAPAFFIDRTLLRVLANERFGRTVDCDMRGSPITDCDVLLQGAYGPAAFRLATLAAQEERKGIDMTRLRELAEVAFAEAEDKDFGGNVITDYSILLQDKYGYGMPMLKLARLAREERESLNLSK